MKNKITLIIGLGLLVVGISFTVLNQLNSVYDEPEVQTVSGTPLKIPSNLPQNVEDVFEQQLNKTSSREAALKLKTDALELAIGGDTMLFDGCTAIPHILRAPVDTNTVTFKNIGPSEVSLYFSGKKLSLLPGEEKISSAVTFTDKVTSITAPVSCGKSYLAGYVMFFRDLPLN